jgi:hypothetical protein
MTHGLVKMPGRVLMIQLRVVALHLLVAGFSLPGIFGQTAQTTSDPLREVHGQTIISNEMPAAELTFGKDFQYLGAQRVNLYGNADAEQHLFVKAGSRGVVERFYWIQFEHFLPSNQYTYDYQPERTTEIGSLNFIYDVKSWPSYADMQIEDPGSDGAAISRLLAVHHLALPQQAVRVRMFHLPTPKRRTELMIIYGEAVPDGSSIPVGQYGTVLDKDAPEAARLLLEHAKRDLTIQKR